MAVAVSGGADSLYALASLSRSHARIIALHGLFLPQPESQNATLTSAAPDFPAPTSPTSPDSPASPTPASPTPDFPAPDSPAVLGLREACAQLGVELHVLDLRHAFDKAVVQPFMDAYLAGQTPNPCAHCNAHIKFGALWNAARALGADALATGHYAALALHPVYGLCLRQGQDMAKDQSYFLSLVPLENLRHALFPLASQQKAQALAHLHSAGLRIPLPTESQDICFVPTSLQDGYRTFIKAQAQSRGMALGKAGPMRLPNGRVVGQHQGLWQYTQGQRRGLGIAWTEPLYVTGKDTEHNTLLLGTKADCTMQDCTTHAANFLVAPALWPQELFVRVRYRQPNMPAQVHISPQGHLQCLFAQSQQAAAPGQIATVYDAEGVVLAGAVIT